MQDQDLELDCEDREVKDSNRKSGNSLDSSFVYGTKAASKLPLLLHM